MKKSLILFLVLGLSIALISCGKNSNSSKIENASSSSSFQANSESSHSNNIEANKDVGEDIMTESNNKVNVLPDETRVEIQDFQSQENSNTEFCEQTSSNDESHNNSNPKTEYYDEIL